MARIFLAERDMRDDFRRLLEWLDADPSGAAECVPAVDVFETADSLEVIVDLPGVPAESVRVVYSPGLLVIAGAKRPAHCPRRETAFHLAERSFGKFARGIALAGAFDAGRAEARLDAGELLIVLPRIGERRGREIQVPIRTA